MEDPDDTVKKILSDMDHLSIHQLPLSKCIIPWVHDLESCFTFSHSLPQSTLEVEHDPVSGELLGFKETCMEAESGKSARNSTSMKRQPDHLSGGIRGSTSNCPFLPGGFDDLDISKMLLNETTSENNVDFKKLLTTPPGFERGVEFKNPNGDWLLANQSTAEVISVNDLIGVNFDLLGSSKQKAESKEVSKPSAFESLSKLTEVIKLEHRREKARDDFINNSVSITEEDGEESKYVCIVDVQQPVKNFKKLLPDPAIKYEFELDTFQKQAILHMENNNNVFVAAHTSAGKTVVAEYAIALSLRHMTKTIYTSPIKALSNQKFREFKHKFKDVGLVTGDVQIGQDANILVMTTEILRSMLYNGSDVIRDLEWVIFDEVHYINDAERGVVWEEVLILLPAHVKIVMLSATVPNTKEFAEWVGRIKRKKVYVMSTPKRPVPLEHYLYTGNNTKTANELFLLLNANKEFLTQGHQKAVEAKKLRASKVDQSYGAKRTRYTVNPKLEQQIWSSIILQLEKQNRTPAVAFVFSKRRIDDNTHNLTTLDLLTPSQKSAVNVFFKNSIKVLKPPDRELPQVRNLKALLERGIGIHHSGVLPILKEIVEMLFQKGLVKVLFATETFAMGVNMPARTVIFDSIQKHDSEKMRDLLPGEYIQMAGRAGRRGLDTTGTVIILCKNDVPEVSDLHRMMMGMPMVLKSQFRVTYSMVLNLMRVEQLRIQDMMRRSFGEFGSEKNSDKLAARLKELRDLLEKENAEEGSTFSSISTYLLDLPDYYEACNEYYQLKDRVKACIFNQYQSSKFIAPGRVVVLRRVGQAVDVPGVVLCPVQGREKTFKVLINGDEMTSSKVTKMEEEELTLDPRSYLGVRLHKAVGSVTPKVVEVTFREFSMVTSKVIKVNQDKIIDDIKKREIPRFRDDPPGQSTLSATQELLRFIDSAGVELCDLDPVNDLHIQDIDIVEMRMRLKFIEDHVKSKFKCTQDPMFEERFKGHRRKKKMEEEIADITYKLSDQSLFFLPEYQQRVQVLRALGHVDEDNRIKMKGKVACEIKTQEILLTELIFNNLFSNLEPEVIAAILSVVVFEQKRCSEPNLNQKLKEVYGKFETLAKELTAVQRQFKLEDDVMEQCNFGLMEVVYEWARGVPFAKLTELTDVQEGVIVRCIQRLDEIFRDIAKAARIVGDPVLGKKMEEASKLIRRDIVFTASLYVQD